MSYKEYHSLLAQSLDRYGDQTCFLVESRSNNDEYQMILFDIEEKRTVYGKNFIKIIPKLVSQNYTVVVISKINENKMDIVAVHQPSPTHATVAPFF